MPCLPTRAQRAPSGEQWIHEVKHDGYRLIAERVGDIVRLHSKNGADYAKRYPLIAGAMLKLRVKSVVLDGEAMCYTPQGLPDFDGLWNRAADTTVRLCAFDLLELNGVDYRPKPLLERKAALVKLLQKKILGLEYVNHMEGDGPLIFTHACKLGLEGIVSKRGDLPYKAGPSKAWLKIKNPDHAAMVRVRDAFAREKKTASR